MMTFRFIAVYQIRGLTHKPEEGDIQIYSKESHDTSFKAILTSNSDQYCYDIDRALAVGYLMLKGLIGQSVSDAVDLEIAEIRERRKIDMEGAVALIFIAEGETDADLSRPNKETNDYVVGFDVIVKNNITSTYHDQINATIAALCLASERTSIQVKKLRSDVYLINENNKPVYSMVFSGSGELYSAMPITAEIINLAQLHIKRPPKQALIKVYKHLTQAISRENDELRRFMFGWAGLETLVKSAFSNYEQLFVQSLLGAEPASPTHRYFKRIREVMKGKYNIADQFAIMAACIGNESGETDIVEFLKIKKVRDALFHDTTAAEKGLPSFEVVELLKKYLRLHTITMSQVQRKLTTSKLES